MNGERVRLVHIGFIEWIALKLWKYAYTKPFVWFNFERFVYYLRCPECAGSLGRHYTDCRRGI